MLREGVNGSSALACRGGAYFAGGELARRGGPARRRDEAGSDGGIHRRLVTVACGGRSEKEGSPLTVLKPVRPIPPEIAPN